ncbi:LamB/YcsF family protein [Halomonas sp. HAL1]|uniref:LamB/YcsF family protein n=1 Tax=Halomonas sp. HAL1 TaxID=550984 RepID=UPI00022D27B4|nr:5-oxoprolinase subunit PxpA [Halomonas sp. HAL1]EHA15095.1 LamB/YcsF family protein [Halomonas sp. HAL1]WKV94168.1 5-oxoprolinase subunit PxpA [Halomonas sp. HAL1]
MKHVDINADMGEGYGHYTIGDDSALLQIVSSANIACGFHAGDPIIMSRTIELAKAQNVDIGAHPGFPDIHGFGRRRFVDFNEQEIKSMLAYQVGAIKAIASMHGAKVSHFKVHGALANMAANDEILSRAIVDCVKEVDKNLLFVIPPFSVTEKVAEKAGLNIAREVFADRAYGDNGYLLPRREKGAVIHDTDYAAKRVLQMVEEGQIETINGKKLKVSIDSICVHGDNPESLNIAKQVKMTLEKNGWKIKPLSLISE